MLKNFRTYDLAIEFYRECEKLKIPSHLRDQLLRASSSIALNLAIAFGSLREVETILRLQSETELLKKSDCLAAHLYRLCY